LLNFLKELTHKRTSTFTNSNAPRWNFCDLTGFLQNVLELMLYSYAFMVSGLFIPVLGALFWKKSHPIAAFEYALWRTTTILLIITENKLPLG
jgi:SSS family solute:Na+ symporter